MVLSDCDILARQNENGCSILITPFRRDKVQPASVDLTLYDELLVPQKLGYGARMDLRRHQPVDQMQRVRFTDYDLRPGAAVIGATAERLAVPTDLVARVEGKSSLGRLFLAVHITAGFIDPGFAGHVTLEIVNHGPWTIVLHAGMDIAQVSFTQLTSPVLRAYGDTSLGSHYQHQHGPTAAAGRRAS